MIGVFEGIEVGSWYRIPGGSSFEIVALDIDSETLEIQYYDGSVEELDFDNWLEMGAYPTAAPDDVNGALDIGREDYGRDFESMAGPTDWSNPLDQLDWQ